LALSSVNAVSSSTQGRKCSIALAPTSKFRSLRSTVPEVFQFEFAAQTECPVVAPGEAGFSAKFWWRFGVPIPDRFEHLAATIAEATPLYELCASVLEA